jgi:superfamily II DNA or RNA helicase
MHHVIISKINYAQLYISCDDDVALELSETFMFDVIGAKYSNLYKSGQWDGRIRLFNLGTRLIGSGLLNRVLKFCDDREYTYEVKQLGTNDLLNLSIEEVSDYMTSLNLYARGVPLNIRDYQIKAVQVALNQRSVVLNSAVGSGKSMILFSISRYITEELDGRVLIIVPTIGLTTQLKSDFKDYSSANGYDVESNVHLISAGADKNISKKIVVSTFQSLKDVSKDWINSFHAIITDEGHKITADSFKKIYDKATEVPYRMACTGTVHEVKCNLLQMEAITGPVVDIAKASDLIEAGQLVPLKVKGISLNYDPEICKAFSKITYDDEIKWIVTNPKRNNFIKKLALSCVGTTLILFRFIEQGKMLYNTIKEAVGGSREVYYVDGSVDAEEREVFRLAANKNDAILICSYATTAAGVNLPALQNIIVASPIKSAITFGQSLGRGLRLFEGKTHCNLFDIGDNLTYKKKVNTTYSHFGERLQILSKEGHEFTIVNVDFK